jgi:hypothetical protein
MAGVQMNNVVDFPKTDRSLPKADVAAVGDNTDVPKAELTDGFLRGLWLVVRLPVFLLMYWLRMPVMLVCNLVSIPMLLLWLFSLYAFPDKHAMVWGFGIISFLAFVIGWTYDFILMAISPQDMMKTL